MDWSLKVGVDRVELGLEYPVFIPDRTNAMGSSGEVKKKTAWGNLSYLVGRGGGGEVHPLQRDEAEEGGAGQALCQGGEDRE